MPVGRSGRIVVELDPELKRRLHARLRSEGLDFKGWLLQRVQDYLETSGGSPGIERSVPELSELERRVLEVVSSRALHHVDQLVHATGLEVRQVQEALLQLELKGCVVQQLGAYQRAP